ncbi:hypothetical protein TeGR_g4461, partial [Tetraparma gracilis]
MEVDYGADLKVVRGKTTGVVRFKSTNDDTQCEVTLVQHMDAGGFLPERVVVAKIPKALSGVAEMRELFQRDDAIDGAKGSELAAIINTSEQPYLPDEDKLIDEVGVKFASLPAFEKLDSPDHFVHMSVAFKEGSSSAILKASTIVDAPIAEVAAWEMAKMSRENQKEHVAFGGLDRDLVKINDHQNVFHVVFDLSIPRFLPRQWVTKIVWKWAADKKALTVVVDDVKHGEFPERKEYLRAASTHEWTYRQEAKAGELPQTKVTYTVQVDVGGAIPKWAQNRKSISQLMYLSVMRKRFDKSPAIDAASNLRLVTMIQNHDEVYTEKEEEILKVGMARLELFTKSTAEVKKAKSLTPTVKNEIAYKEGDPLGWGRSETLKVVANKLRPAGDSKVKLCNMTVKQANVIGGALASCIAANLTAPAAVDEWILRYPAMGEMEREYVWFRPMMDSVAQRLLESVSWGLKMRLYTGAGLSTLDLITDLYMIYIIIVSALTTGFGAAVMSFDYDVNPKRRRDEPNFYGYIPDAASSRTLTFFCMIVNGALLLLVRSVSMALLAMVGGQWVLVYLVSDVSLYFTYKILRGDLWHWVPLEGAASIVQSVLERLVVKVLVDFTGVIQFRGAGEMGGCYFSFNMIVALAASFVATHIYYASLEEGKEAVMEEGDAWMMVGGLSGGLICFEAAFLLLMKSGYKGTFFSTQTGYQYVQSKFLREGDENKKAVFKYNKKQWLSIRGDVKAWTLENWERWEEEQPEWFTDAWKARIDEDM